MQPILLKGHERPLTTVKFNREGDLLFTCAKDYKPQVWFTDNGERLGTYIGHKGTVWHCDVDFQSTRLLTGSSDTSAKLWDVKTGTELFTFPHKSGVRSVGFATGERMILTAQDNQYSQQPSIFIYNLADDVKEQTADPVRTMFEPGCQKINTALWGSLNQTIISGDDGGCIRVWDVEYGKQTSCTQEHKKAIHDVAYSKDHQMFITSSADMTARLFDCKSMKCIKTFQSDRPLNAAAISPLMNHVILGGGQEAMNVTTTGRAAGHFEVDFYHIVYQTLLGQVKGHFGPVNCLSFSPDGRSYVSGSEDGYVRLHHFEKEHLNSKNQY